MSERNCDFCGFPNAKLHYGDYYCTDCHKAVLGIGPLPERLKEIWELPSDTDITSSAADGESVTGRK